ncbi:MAG: hypothetical protein V1867_02910 [Candidatus Falkowbacteria bacterium]
MTPDEIVRKAREENQKAQEAEKAKREVFDRIFDKFKDRTRKIMEEDAIDEEDMDQFDEETDKLREEAWENVRGIIDKDGLDDVEENIDEFLDSVFGIIDEDDYDNLPNESLRKLKEIRKQDEFLKKRAAKKKTA